ncbi:antitoxin [Streptomyces echinoruber]|uniref:Antitoxin n=1 Tax=Streptomyces echinoruber TaxID=68898 RepID=A0A918VBN8_9ACTN|nr:antitoxin [Streptomyces echinoruber]GGZ89247.1 hypothetical protein GCM10010389_29400 [Streptomyces echinoruber]
MRLLDNVKARMGPARDKVSDLAQRHGGKIEHGLDRAAKLVDEKTKGKYSRRIQAGTGKAKQAMDRLAHKSGPADTTGAPGGGPAGTREAPGGGPAAAPPPGTAPPTSSPDTPPSSPDTPTSSSEPPPPTS